ncbi:glycosyltransferase [Comamonas aquatica]|uniref:Glycosyltransferase n=1 Tax=Comamonas aquatica TaxID=225991 RepID=A0AA42HUB5_9BURK|nr:glycosyltransferase [Comamonas aquatica]MDH0364468.1 glycosyltransferase [Comamonas aquatica]
MTTIVHWGKYYPPEIGGIESVTESLARGAADAGAAVTVVCFGKSKSPNEDCLDGVRVLRAPIFTSKASQPLGWRYLRWALREGRMAHVVHMHAPNMLAALAGLLLGRQPKLVVHWHSDVVNKGWIGRILQPLQSAVLRRADRIVCTSQIYANASLPLRPFISKVTVVPIGVAAAAEPLNETESEGLPAALRERLSGRRLVLAVGRLVPYKGFHVLVEAAGQLTPDAVVVIVGTGPLQGDLQRRIDAAGITHKVVLAGRQSNEVLRQLFKQAVLFCLPSVERSEAFGVVLIEAMSHGLPVVATQIPGSGVSWVNAHRVSGLNVPVGDAPALAAACNEILTSDSLRAAFSQAARERFEIEFTEQVSTDRILKVYRSLLNDSF